MLKKALRWIYKDKVLLIAFTCAVITAFLVPPDKEYGSYINLQVLCLLFCLMAVVAGLKSCGAFQWLAAETLKHGSKGYILGVGLVLLPFFTSMLITNDVALLTFVPFTLIVLQQIHCEKVIIIVLVLQTIAANLGSMATPVGNPQNLFLYTNYHLTINDFFAVMMPLTVLSFMLLTVAALFVLPKNLEAIEIQEEINAPKKLVVYLFLFVLCILTVLDIISYQAMSIVVVSALLMMDKNLLKDIDYGLLVTFVCFFIVSGNLGRIEILQETLHVLLEKSTLLTATLASQIISNVPSAVLLSNFTNDWSKLLEGVNIGGLGTPIASLASLITLKLYLAEPNANIKRFMVQFMLCNLMALAILLCFEYIF